MFINLYKLRSIKRRRIMEKNKKILSGIFAIIMEESMTSDVYE